MPVYLSQLAYTADAWAALVAKPADRTDVVRSLVEQIGGRLISLYYCFGTYDAVVLTEAPDNQSISAALLAAVAPGHVKTISSAALFTPQEMVGVLRRAGELKLCHPDHPRL